VRAVEDDSPAAEAGIQAGDVIVEVDRHTVRNADDMRRRLDDHAKGTPVLMLLHRGESSLFVTIDA